MLSFARALVADARVLVLDEATANVDSYTELKIQQALVRLLEGRTALVIAHRLTTIRGADRIIVLQDGTIIEEGTHNELMASGGLYKRSLPHELRKLRRSRRQGYCQTDVNGPGHLIAGAANSCEASLSRHPARTGGGRRCCVHEFSDTLPGFRGWFRTIAMIRRTPADTSGECRDRGGSYRFLPCCRNGVPVYSGPPAEMSWMSVMTWMSAGPSMSSASSKAGANSSVAATRQERAP